MTNAPATHQDQQQRLYWLANVARLAAYAAAAQRAQNATEAHHEAPQGLDPEAQGYSLDCLPDVLDGLAFELERLAT